MKPYRIIVAGTRTFCDYAFIKDKLDSLTIDLAPEEIEEVCGGAPGPDLLGKRWAHAREIDVVHFPANWKLFGKSAGMRRNELMARHGTHLVLFWDGQSRGSKDMLERAKKHGLDIRVITIG